MSHLSLHAHGVAFEYPTGVAPLRQADVDIEPGSRVAMVGANGSGKTTLLRILAGSLEPTAGTVDVDGVPLRYGRRGLRQHRQTVQLVMQNPDDQLFSADVRHDIAFGPANLGLTSGEIAERVEEALAMLSIEALADRPTHELSYGERKRVSIAGAMAMRPCVLLLDEPTAGLDPVGVYEMFTALNILERNNTTVVMSTHDTALAMEWATSVAVVHSGRVHQGAPQSQLRDPALLAAARLHSPWSVALADQLSRRGITLPDSRPPRSVTDFADQICTLRSRCLI